MENIESRIEKIEERNKHGEADKTWETSWTRRIFVAVATYFVIGIFMTAISVAKPWTNAIIPTLGFLLSTLSLSFVKDIWIRNRK